MHNFSELENQVSLSKITHICFLHFIVYKNILFIYFLYIILTILYGILHALYYMGYNNSDR